jgi:hypothetical protein
MVSVTFCHGTCKTLETVNIDLYILFNKGTGHQNRRYVRLVKSTDLLLLLSICFVGLIRKIYLTFYQL